MKKSEMKKIAKQIATYEIKLQKSQTAEERKFYEEQIVILTSSIEDIALEDLLKIDDMVHKILEEKI